jgi:hypothetical protein
MASGKNYAVVIFENAADEIASFTGLWLKREIGISYFYSHKIDPSGAYFHLTLRTTDPDGALREFELQLPHSFIKAVFYAADFKSLGFTSAP